MPVSGDVTDLGALRDGVADCDTVVHAAALTAQSGPPNISCCARGLAAPTFKGTFGYHPVLAYLDNNGEALAGVLRSGNVGANTAADHVCPSTSTGPGNPTWSPRSSSAA